VVAIPVAGSGCRVRRGRASTRIGAMCARAPIRTDPGRWAGRIMLRRGHLGVATGVVLSEVFVVEEIDTALLGELAEHSADLHSDAMAGTRAAVAQEGSGAGLWRPG